MDATQWWTERAFDPASDEGDLRAHAGRVLRAAVAAVDADTAVVRALAGWEREVAGAGRLRILALGKAADGMARGALQVLGERVVEGLVVGPAPVVSLPPPLVRVTGSHPHPDVRSEGAGEAVLRFARASREGDLVLCLISGGASSMVVKPIEGVGVSDLHRISEVLLRSGAPIEETNAVRRRLDVLKGGGLGVALAPARVIGLLISDVPGDDPRVIGSGPLSPDPSSWEEVQEILVRRGCLDAMGPRVRSIIAEGVAGVPANPAKPYDARLAHISVQVIAASATALRAAEREAETLGYRTFADGDPMRGEARRVGAGLAGELIGTSGRVALLKAGETTVTVEGSGRGGRNQELVLGAAGVLAGHGGSVLCAMGTDGIDGPTDAAGGLVTGRTLERAGALGLDPDRALAENDSYPFLRTLGDLIISGPTGTNVGDLALALARSSVPTI